MLHHRTVHLFFFFLFLVVNFRIVRFLYRAVEEVKTLLHEESYNKTILQIASQASCKDEKNYCRQFYQMLLMLAVIQRTF